MELKEDTPARIARRKYEEKNKEKRKAMNGTFSTYMPRNELEEINNFLKLYNVTKIDLIRIGYETLKNNLIIYKK